MKRSVTNLLFFLLVIIIAINCEKKETKIIIEEKTPLDYHDIIFREHVKIVNSIIEFSKAFDGANEKEMKNKLGKIQEQTSKSIEKLENLGPYKGDDAFRKCAINLFEFYKSISENEFEDMIDIQIKKGSQTQEDMDKMREFNSKIASKENELNAKFLDAEKNFANKNGFNLENYKFNK